MKKLLFSLIAAILVVGIMGCSNSSNPSNNSNEDGSGTGTVTNTSSGGNENPPSTYIGTKAPNEAKAVGDIVFSDGSATPYSANLTLTDTQINAAIAVIFYVGTECSNDTSNRTLGVGLAQSNSGLAWCTSDATAYNTNISTIQCSVSGALGEYTFTSDNGRDNFIQLANFSGVNDTETETNYPAWYFAKNYKNQTNNHVISTSYENGWYLPSICELFYIWKNKTVVDAAIGLCGGVQFGTNTYWSSSQSITPEYNAFVFRFQYGDKINGSKENISRSVCAIRSFNNSTSSVTGLTYRGVMSSTTETVYIDFSFIDDSNWISQGYDSTYTSTKPQGTTFGTYSISGTTITINMPAFQTELTGTTSNNWTSIACTGFFSGTMTKQ